MRKLAGIWAALMGALAFVPSAFAAGQAPAAGHGGELTATGAVITAGFAMGIASGLCGIGQGIASAGASQGFARNPAASTVIQNMLILSLVLIESLALYTLLMIVVYVK
ncbi:MAG TPA: ATP synthase F0 subunit C [Candidatus Acidoferrales bacterium]|nr:ATP synthase F0 subunit C [Candidatus Acidoferrales bacterium]